MGQDVVFVFFFMFNIVELQYFGMSFVDGHLMGGVDVVLSDQREALQS